MMQFVRNLQFAWKSPSWRRALLIAIISDALGFGVVLFPPVQWILDAVTAIALVIVLGFRWKLLIALAIEVIPAIQLFPAWTLVIAAMAAIENKEISGKQETAKKHL
jgi:hypothetical protein